MHRGDGSVRGQIVGMSSTNVAYAVQAATDITLYFPIPGSPQSITVKAPIHKGKFDDIIYFNINARNLERLSQVYSQIFWQTTEFYLRVKFMLKHSYFANNHRSLEHLIPSVLSKLVPRKEDLELSLKAISHIPMPPIELLSLDKEYQFIALKKILGCSSNAIFLVTGPFGTGKTRLLATAAYNILKQPNTRVLICTSHIQSADSYIYDYFSPMFKSNLLQGITPVRLISGGRFSPNPDHEFDFIPDGGRPVQDLLQSRLVVTTLFLTLRLQSHKPQPYTHILIDEGAQTREPEAVAPLSLADSHTKIVVAGDHLQVKQHFLRSLYSTLDIYTLIMIFAIIKPLCIY